MDPWQIIQLLFCAVVTVLAWVAKRQIDRIDVLDRTKADKESLDKSVTELKDAMKEHRQETREAFTRVFERLDDVVDRLPSKS